MERSCKASDQAVSNYSTGKDRSSPEREREKYYTYPALRLIQVGRTPRVPSAGHPDVRRISYPISDVIRSSVPGHQLLQVGHGQSPTARADRCGARLPICLCSTGLAAGTRCSRDCRGLAPCWVVQCVEEKETLQHAPFAAKQARRQCWCGRVIEWWSPFPASRVGELGRCRPAGLAVPAEGRNPWPVRNATERCPAPNSTSALPAADAGPTTLFSGSSPHTKVCWFIVYQA